MVPNNGISASLNLGANSLTAALLAMGAGSAAAPALAFSADLNNGIFYGGTDIVALSTAGTERARILANGNMLIGTTTDVNAKLYVNGNIAADDTLFVLGDAGAGAASTLGLTNIGDVSANSSGTGTIKFKGTTSRDSAGFIKIYFGTTVYYVPIFTAITG